MPNRRLLGLGLGFKPRRGGTPAPILIPASTRNTLPGTRSVGGGVAGAENGVGYRVNNTGATLTEIQLQFFTLSYDATMTRVNAGNSITVTATVEYPIGGTRYQATLGGSASMVVADAGYLRTDPIPGLSIPAGAIYKVRVWRNIPASTAYIQNLGSTLASLAEASSYGGLASQPDRTVSGTPTAVNGGGIPCWVLAKAPAGTKAALVIGDSIDVGLNETSAFTGDANGNIGAAERWLSTKGRNTINIARSSSQAFHWATKDISALVGCLSGMTFSDIWCGLGRNDYAASRTAAQIKADVETSLAKFTALLAAGGNIVLRDAPPTTTSTDAWLTDANQARAGGAPTQQETYRQGWKAIVSALGVSGQTKYFNLAGTTDVARAGDSLVVWATNGVAGDTTTDGIHPGARINAAAATANSGLVL